MSKILKGVFIYTFIILGIVLILGMLVFGIMFMTADSDTPFALFGYKAIYVVNGEQPNQLVQTIDYENGDVLNLTINGGNFHVFVTQAGDTTENIVVKKTDQLFGLYKGTYNPQAVTSVTKEEGIIKATITAPQLNGLVSYGESYIQVIVPDEKEFVLNLIVENTGGDVTIDGTITNKPTKKIIINTLNVTTTTGDLNMKAIGSLNETEHENTEQTNVTLNGIYFKTDGGNFDLSNINRLTIPSSPSTDVITDTIEINSKRGDFKFHDVVSSMNIHGEDVRIDANIINTNERGFTFNSPNGFFKIKELITTGIAANVITTNVVNVDIETVTGETAITTTYGNISIKTLNNNATLESTNGNITVSIVAKGNLTAISKFGKINVQAYESNAYFKNEKGSITATYVGEAVNAEEKTEIVSKDGAIALGGILNSTDITTTGSATVTLTFAQLAQTGNITHKITLNKGSATLKMQAVSPFKVKASGNVNGSVGSTNIATLVSENGNNVFSVFDATETSCLFDLNAGSGKITFATIE